MDRFLHGYNNRFVPIEVPVEGTNEIFYMQFKGRGINPSDTVDKSNPLTQRRLTWCDVFYIACVESVKDKHVLITRFPIFHMKTIIGLRNEQWHWLVITNEKLS